MSAPAKHVVITHPGATNVLRVYFAGEWDTLPPSMRTHRAVTLVPWMVRAEIRDLQRERLFRLTRQPIANENYPGWTPGLPLERCFQEYTGVNLSHAMYRRVTMRAAEVQS